MSHPTARLRQRLHDTAAKNTFLKAEEFTDSELEASVDAAISFWNSSRPLLENLEVSGWSKVPEARREPFLTGALGLLLSDKVHHLSRNRQPAVVEGVGVDPERRAEDYARLGREHLSLFLQWVGAAKHSLAVNGVIAATPAYEPSFLQFYKDTALSTTLSVTGRDGKPFDLTGKEAVLRLAPMGGASDSELLLEKTLPHDNSELALELEASDLTWAGVAEGELALSEDDVVTHRFRLCTCSDPTLLNVDVLTVERLRAHLRDRSGEGFVLGDDVEFTNSDLAKAVADPVRHWNSSPPLLRRHVYTPLTFPKDFLLQWEDAAAGYALRTASRKLVRNNLLPDQGSALDTGGRAEAYARMGDALVADWRSWVRDAKTAINLSSPFGRSSRTGYGLRLTRPSTEWMRRGSGRTSTAPSPGRLSASGLRWGM